MEVRLITAEEVVASLSMEDAIEAMKSAFAAYSSGESPTPLRLKVETEKGVTLIMPAVFKEKNAFAVKLVSIYDGNPALGHPRISAVVLALDPETGRPIAMMDGESLTALRTGAAGGVAADLLSRRDANSAALFGAGIQGRTQLKAAMTVRKIERVFLFDLDRGASERLAEELRAQPNAPAVQVAESPKEAVEDADIVLTATPARAPVFDGRDLKPGTHVTAIGAFTPEMQEVDAFTVKKARVFVDSIEACLVESGELIHTNAEIEAEIGDVINGVKPGRQNELEITFFKSVGIATQDVIAASAVLRNAAKGGLGCSFDFKAKRA